MTTHEDIFNEEAFYTISKEKQRSWNSIDLVFIQQVLLIIQNNMNDETFNAATLAQKSFVSISQLNRRLKKLLNISSASLIRHIRMHYAIELLTNKGFSIRRTAFEVGYKNQANFCRCFKKMYGVAPSRLGGERDFDEYKG